MISVIIPILRIPPYDEQIKETIKCLERQKDVEVEIIVSEQEKGKLINKNKLLNDGFKKAKGEYIWHCDADFLIDDDFLVRVCSSLIRNNLEVIYPMFFTDKHKVWRIVDGGPFMKREVLERHGPLDTTLIGISFVTFPFLGWCLDYTRMHCSRLFTLEVNKEPFVKSSDEKSDPVTFARKKRELVKIINRLVDLKLIPTGLLRGTYGGQALNITPLHPVK